MAACFVKGKSVTVVERNEKPGKKLYITGKGRCNVTNDCSPSDFLNNVVNNSKFLFSSLYGFSPQDTIDFLEKSGVKTKTERGNRVFPCSDKSSDVIKALYRTAVDNGVVFRFNERVVRTYKNDLGFTVLSDDNEYRCKYLMIACGGKSYPATGSTGDGYVFAEKFGHRVISPKPSLVPLGLKQDVSALAGLSLKNVSVSIVCGGRTYSQFGEMLFTHDGVSGPSILRLSAYINREPLPMELYIDLKPALDEETLDKRIASDFAESGSKQLKNSLDRLLPKAMVMPVIVGSGVSGEKKANAITKAERLELVRAVKNLKYDINCFGSFENAVVTSGGVDTKELSPKTMESKLVENLYFIGEVTDVDALTGGFNIQIALSTAYAAASAVTNDSKAG